MMSIARSAGFQAVLLCALLLISGCGQGRPDRFTPSAATAKSSIEAALEAWREGLAPGPISNQTPAVHVVDTVRSPGQKLRDYQVLSETRASGAGRLYVVRLTLDNPAAQERARFIVVGVDPIWVFRKEDYDHLAHWEHPMPAASTTAEQPAGPSPPAAAATADAPGADAPGNEI